MQKQIVTGFSTVVILTMIVIGGWFALQPRQSFLPVEDFKTPTRKPNFTKLKRVFPKDSKSVWENSDRMILYSLDPNGFVKKGFHRYAIIGQTEIKSRKVRADLVAHFYDGMEEKIYPAGCFEPHHAIRAIKENKTVDLLICFACSGVEIYYGELYSKTHVAKTPQAFYDAVLTEAGVPLRKP